MAPLLRRGTDFEITPNLSSEKAAFDFHAKYDPQGLQKLENLRLSLLGEHQRDNAALAITAVDLIRQAGWKVSEDSLRQGLTEAKCPGCVEHVGSDPDIVLDGAHNEIAILALLDSLKSHFQQPIGQRHLLFACAEDKNPEAMLKILLPYFGSATFTQFTTSPRGANPEMLLKLAISIEDREYKTIDNPQEAWADLHRSASPQDLLCVTGSIYLAGEVTTILRNEIPAS